MPSKVVFRTNQRLKSNDGGAIYLKTSGICELYEGDRCVVVCTYTIISHDEIQLLDENGNPVYKASFTYASDRLNISTLVLGGTRYFRF